MSDYYILEGHRAVKTDGMIWSTWIRGAERHVGDEMVGDVQVSTVFLGLDHGFGYSPPLLFETMVFGGPLDQEQDRYTTWEQAEEGHKDMVERVRKGGIDAE
uniref:Uncharacterized protein n=1 Tax=viral metagenome TaxID=1070528 RepID=A0A6M3JHR5_9ZZZZ